MTDHEILTKTLYYEAGSTENIEDIIAIAWVIRNRVDKAGWFGTGYYGVCTKPYQFSCWNNVKPESISIGNSLKWDLCKTVALYVMSAPDKWNPLPNCYYYYNPDLCSPSWAKKMKEIYYDPHLDHRFVR